MQRCHVDKPKNFPPGQWVWVPLEDIAIDGNTAVELKFDPPTGNGYFEAGDIYFGTGTGDGDGDGDGDIDDCRLSELSVAGSTYFPYRAGDGSRYIGSGSSGGNEGNGFRMSELTQEAAFAYGGGQQVPATQGTPAAKAFQHVPVFENREPLTVKVECIAAIGSKWKGGAIRVRRLTDAEAEKAKNGGRTAVGTNAVG